MEIILKENERIDNLHRNNYKIIQNEKKFCFGLDAVLLSHFAKAKKGDKVFDIGTGNAIIPILMEAKTTGCKFFAIDIQEDIVDIARRSVFLNKLEDKIFVEHLDIKNVFEKFNKNSFNVVVTNPPYMKNAGFINNPSPKAIARHEISCTLQDIIQFASSLLISQGAFYMVHRAERLADIMQFLREFRLEPKLIQFVQPYENKAPNLVLIKAVKNGKNLLKILPNLIIYNKDNKYTKKVYEIYYN